MGANVTKLAKLKNQGNCEEQDPRNVLGKLLLIAKTIEALGYGACAAPAKLDLRRGIWPTIYSKVIDVESNYFA